ncbi:FimV/HubP family polar landmark protein, partial [Alteromonas australica]
PDTAELDLDVSLSDFTGVNDNDAVIDIDKDAGQNANLDLARVYIEMDDVPAAKELLDEVVSQGSEEQKQEAESILKSIS